MQSARPLWLVLGLSALATTGRGARSSPEAASDPSAVEGTWVLEAAEVAGEQLVAHPEVRTELTFEGGRAVGHGGVNRFSGPYEATDEGGISIGPVAATRMAGPPHAMEQEDRFLAALGASARFVVGQSRLSLLDDADQRLVVLVLASR
jgi:heat shock protein HslJ